MASALTEFTTLMESQGPAFVKGPESIVNEMVKNTYTMRYIAAGNDIQMDMVGGGDEIKDRVFLDLTSTFQRVGPDAHIDYVNPQTGQEWSIPWSFSLAHMAWTEPELALNTDKHTGAYRRQRYKKVMYQKLQQLMTDVCNSVEDEMWAQPDYDSMEGTATGQKAQKPYSIPCFINEETNGVPLVWTGNNVQGLSASTYDKWRPHQGTYTFATTSALTMATIFPAFEETCRKIKFEQLWKSPELSEKPSEPRAIFASNQGIKNYNQALRTNQDVFRGMGSSSGQDPHYGGPTFNGIPLVYISNLDTAALYDNGSGAYATEAGADLSGPRYYFINGKYMNFAVHDEHYCKFLEVTKLPQQPYARVQNVSLWNNLFVRSRRRHAIVSPSADTTNA